MRTQFPEQQPDLFPETKAPGDVVRRARGRRATLAVAAVGAVFAVGAWAAISSSLGPEDRAPDFVPEGQPTLSIEVTNKLPLKTAAGSYLQPSQAQVERAFADVSAFYADGGLARLARESSGCFSRLAGQPTYDLLDYCIAFDTYAEAIHAHASGRNRTAQSVWFEGAGERRLSAARAVLTGRGDAEAHLRRIHTLALGEPEPPPPVRQAPIQQAVEKALQSAPPPAVTRTAAPTEAPKTREEPIRIARAEPRPVPASPRPSFNCRYARTQSERMVCSDPDLARADRRLAEAFEGAVANGADRSLLRAEQDRWLRYREAAAPDPYAVAEVYEQRITELQAMANYRYSGRP